jgi:hypothetical protein
MPVMEQLQIWLDQVNEMRRKYHEAQFTHVAFDPCVIDPKGRKYIRIIRDGSAFCFVKREDGTIWKPKGWKGPELNFSRGSIYDADVTGAVGQYGTWTA